jgi:hypothetical protein
MRLSWFRWRRCSAALVLGAIGTATAAHLTTATTAHADMSSGQSAGAPAGSSDSETKKQNLQRVAIAAQNPISSALTVVIFQNNTEFDGGPYGRTRNELNIEPFIPVSLGNDWGLLSRTIVPVVWQPQYAASTGETFGLSDTAETVFLTRKFREGPVLGLGPVGYFPTATATELGTGNWGLGPAAIAIVQPKPWTFGVILSQVWSLYSPPDRPKLDATAAQVLVAVNLPGGWYINTAPVGTSANWSARTQRDTYLVPVGGGAGKVMKIGPQLVNFLVGAYWNAIRPANVPTPEWQLRLQLSLLFPK